MHSRAEGTADHGPEHLGSAADPKGTMSYRTVGEFLFVRGRQRLSKGSWGLEKGAEAWGGCLTA